MLTRAEKRESLQKKAKQRMASLSDQLQRPRPRLKHAPVHVSLKKAK